MGKPFVLLEPTFLHMITQCDVESRLVEYNKIFENSCISAFTEEVQTAAAYCKLT